MDVVLAVDIGSTSCKAAYLDKQGRMVATGRVNTRQIPVARTETLSGFWEAFGLSVHAASAQLAERMLPSDLLRRANGAVTLLPCAGCPKSRLCFVFPKGNTPDS